MAQKNRYYARIIMVLFVFVALVIGFPPQKSDAAGLNFDVEVVTPDNQLDKQQTYFDLLIKPNQTQELVIYITSLSDKEVVVDVIPTNATTNQNGEVSYSDTTKLMDTTLKYPMTTLLSKKQRVRLAPNETKEIRFQLTSPETPFKGKIVGGFLFQEVSEQKESYTSKGISIENAFALVKGIQLQEEIEEVEPNIDINDILAKTVNYKRAITVNLQNTAADFIHDVSVNVKITRKGESKILYARDQTGISMAPNSNFNFPVYMENQELVSGKYSIEVVIKANKLNKSEIKKMTLTQKQVEDINQKAIDLPITEATNLLDGWLIGTVTTVIVITSGYLIYLFKKRFIK